MRISELSERSGVPVATVKYYLREGLLEPGKVLNARESSYGEDHLSRLRLIRGLVHVLGASISQMRQVLSIIDTPDQAPLEAIGKATSALPTISQSGGNTAADESERAAHLLERLGYRFDPASPTVAQLGSALALADEVGIGIDDDQIAVYGEAARRVARADFSRLPWHNPRAATTFAVLGTALYEPVLLALRRLAHYELGLELEADSAELSNTDTTTGTT